MKKILAVVFVFILFSCKKEESPQCMDGKIRWGGEPAADGFGWYFSRNGGSDIIVLENLGNDYQIDSLAVHICIKKTSRKFYCECERPLSVYHITSISR